MDAGQESVLTRAHLTNHSLLVEDGSQLVLIDTGFGLNDVRDPKSRLSQFFLKQLSPAFREEMTAIRQIERLGYNARDVRQIVLTHLDFDHAGGLDDFPEAKVHMLQSERSSASEQKTWLDRQRFRPQQWNTQKNWITYEPSDGDFWFGFERVKEFKGISNGIAMVPLIGHTFGHCGIAVLSGGRWLLNAGDAYFFHDEMNLDKPRCTPGLAAYQWMMDKDRDLRRHNQKRLRELKRKQGSAIEIFCSHDRHEFERLAGRRAVDPAGCSRELRSAS